MNPFEMADWWRGAGFVLALWSGIDLILDGDYILGGLCLGLALRLIFDQYKAGRR